MILLNILLLVVLSGCERAVFDALLSIDENMPSMALSSFQFSGTPVADGVTPVNVLVTLKNKHSNPLINRPVQVNVSGTGNTVSICPNTNSLGQTSCHIESTWAELKTVTITSGISLIGNLTFLQPAVSQLSASIVIAGDYQDIPAGNKSRSSVGTLVSPNRVFDSNGFLRLHSSIQGLTEE